MKKGTLLLLIIFIIGCQSETVQTDSVSEEQGIQNRTSSSHSTAGATVVIRFSSGISDTEKATIRAHYGVDNYENCSCGDENLESWELAPIHNGATIEERVSSMEEDPEMEGADFTFDIQVSSQVPSEIVLRDINYQSILPKIVRDNKKLVIGVLDTGINPGHFEFSQPFLYNSSLDSDACNGELFGWNHVANSNMPIDDQGHGTIVTSMMYKQLTDNGVDFAILPAKAFDADGNGTLFNISCALSNLVRKTNVINMSFGWTGNPSSVIRSYIHDVKDRVLIVTSAGNTGSDNDALAHYPSSYGFKNIIAVTAVDNAMPPNLVLSEPALSNYGETSVDIAVRGIGIPFYPALGVAPIPVTGSSYSAAKATGFAGTLYIEGENVHVWYNKILWQATYSSTLQQIKYASYLNL